MVIVLAVVALAGCEASGSGGETEPTFEQAQTIAEEQLADVGCEFRVADDSTEDLELKTLECLTTEAGEERLYTVLTYERDEQVDEVDEYFPGFTTSELYFQNDNITVEPAGGNPDGVELDAEAFTTAVQEACGCGEVLTPES